MKPFLAKGYAKRKLHTGNQSVQFDEEREVERPLFYSTPFQTSSSENKANRQDLQDEQDRFCWKKYCKVR